MPAKSVKRPTAGELAILRVLWDRGPSTVRVVHEALGGDARSGYTTTLKLMQIMAEKGLVRRKENGQSHIYYPAGSADQTQRRLVVEVMDKVFGGSARKLILHALSAGKMSDEEIREIKKLLDRRGETDHGNG